MFSRPHLLELLLELCFLPPSSSSLLLLELLLDDEDKPLASSPRSAPCAASCRAVDNRLSTGLRACRCMITACCCKLLITCLRSVC